MKGLFKSCHGMGGVTSWGKEFDVDDSVVPEDRPRLSKSLDPDNGTGENLSPEDGDSEESSTLGAIKTRDEVPRANAALTSPQKPTEVKEKRVKARPFYSSTTQNTTRTPESETRRRRKKLTSKKAVVGKRTTEEHEGRRSKGSSERTKP